MEFHENLQSLSIKDGLKGSKVSRALESFSWNITILKVSAALIDKPAARRSPFGLLFNRAVPTTPRPLTSGPGWPAETRQGWSEGEHEAGARRRPDGKPHQGGGGAEKSSLPNGTRSGWDCKCLEALIIAIKQQSNTVISADNPSYTIDLFSHT